MFEIPGTTPRTDSPITIIVKRPIRSGRCDMCGANCDCNLPAVIGVAKSITSPIPHKTNRNGGGITRHPLDMKVLEGQVLGQLLLPALTYLIGHQVE
jgi:hypothetical protein